MHDMRIPEMLIEMECKLVGYSSQVGWDELYRVTLANKEVKSFARYVEHLCSSREMMTPRQRREFEMAMERTLFYLLYFERLRKYLEGDATPEVIARADLFNCATHGEWVKAQRAAIKQMNEYVQCMGNVEEQQLNLE